MYSLISSELVSQFRTTGKHKSCSSAYSVGSRLGLMLSNRIMQITIQISVVLLSTLTSLLKIRRIASPSLIIISSLAKKVNSILIRLTGNFLTRTPSFQARNQLCPWVLSHLAKAQTHLSKPAATSHLNSQQTWVCHSKVIRCPQKQVPMQI
jgi:hypothetical protein